MPVPPEVSGTAPWAGSPPSDNESTHYSPFVELGRAAWARLAQSIEQPLNQDDVDRLRGIGEHLSLDEVAQVYLPLSRLLNIYVENAARLRSATNDFLGGTTRRTPFIIGVAGSVAVGKSTTARVLQEMLRRWSSTPRVELVTTDGFLYPNAELRRRGLMERKGFPEAYDRRRLLRFVSEVKSGRPEVPAPVYSHLKYDIIPGEKLVVRRPDVLILEGLNVLQPARIREDGTAGLALSDFFDFSIFVDAKPHHIEQWYVDRFMRWRHGAFANPEAYFHQYSRLSDQQAVAQATDIWQRINGPNLRENIHPTRSRARLVMSKDEDHSVARVLLRKV
ncbi:type I pantothenate kinase [Nesterenkonia sphaerica]|uniref:Pantothenate kinase n=1 Tax=Nesterenkonia sphaerica TaxID=1804988 RepID=A0A5R9AH08_9MICC|nr:type I pantothenate kinase [Nesterenkonia sphaerica]TLP77167.1 type I pantothenate kinase [Nesterenkonia sphaerica]